MKNKALVLTGLVLVLALLAGLAAAGWYVDFGPEVCVNVFSGRSGRGYLIGYCAWVDQAPVWMWPW